MVECGCVQFVKYHFPVERRKELFVQGFAGLNKGKDGRFGASVFDMPMYDSFDF